MQNSPSSIAAPRPRLICHVVQRLAVGGLENGVVNLINNLPGETYRHAVVCVTSATEFRQRIRRPDVDIHEIRKRPGKDIGAYHRMWQVLRRLRPHIVHTRNLPALDMLGPAWLAGVPRLVHSEHGLDMIELEGRNRKYNRLRRLSRSVVDRYVAVSRDLEGWLRREIGVPETRLDLIYNGVDTVRFSPMATPAPLPENFAPPGAVVVGTAGRLEAVKNQLGLARAFCRVLEMRPALRQRLRLVVIGSGSQQDEIRATLAAGNTLDLAWLPGSRDDMPTLYRTLDLFVLPSLREGISNTLLEAMASGRPVIATDVGGNPEIMPKDVAGTLVPAQDDAAMASAILRYLDSPELLRAHGEAGRAHTMRNFSLDAMLEKYDRLYRSLL